MLGLTFLALALVLVVGLNWSHFGALGWSKALRLALLWAGIFAGGAALIRLLGIV